LIGINKFGEKIIVKMYELNVCIKCVMRIKFNVYGCYSIPVILFPVNLGDISAIYTRAAVMLGEEGVKADDGYVV
jgi:hypothetical protein